MYTTERGIDIMSIFDLFLGIGIASAENPTGGSTSGATPTGMNDWGSLLGMLIPMLIFVVFLYFIMIRPQKKKDKQVREMLNNLKNGDRICTIGGIYGTITGLKDDTVTLAVGNQDTHMVVARWAIRSVEEVTVENDAEALN